MSENTVKLMAMYLPQYHEIPENNEFWGKGFTDWTTVKAAVQYDKKLKQPKEPLNDNYYDLSKSEDLKWQVELAKKYGIDGFCFYHYWFSSKKQLLHIPAENFLKDKSMDIDFCFAWDNAPWKRTWNTQFGNDWSPIFDKNADIKKNQPSVLMPFEYEGEIGAKKHFEYLLPFFKDDRYIKKDNKPVFIIWNYYIIDELKEMIEVWHNLAKQNGFSGVYIITKYTNNKQYEIADANFYYQPIKFGWETASFITRLLVKGKRIITKNKYPRKYLYDIIWKRILKYAKKSKKMTVYYGGFVNYDDTPRRGTEGRYISGATPEKFGKYMQRLIDISKKHGKAFVFITAWNEWGEGAYLEPDKENEYDYLKVVKKLRK